MIPSTSQPATTPASDHDALILQYVPLVKYVAGKLRHTSSYAKIDFEDLVSYGMIGLIEAARRFDGSQGAQFQSFAILRIRGAIIDGLRQLDPLSRSTRQRATRLNHAHQDLVVRLGRDPSREELRTTAGLSEAQFTDTVTQASRFEASLDAMLAGEDNGPNAPVFDRFTDQEQPHLSARIEHAETLEELAAAIARLPERDRIVLGLFYKEGLSNSEIASALSISESRVSQLKSRSIWKLRGYMRAGLAA